MFIKDSKRINVHAPHTTPEGVQYANLLNPDVRAALGVVEVAEPEAPADYSDETYYRTEQDDAPYVVFTRKSDEQIAQVKQAKIQAQIDSLEASTLLPRVTREFMLGAFEAQAAAAGVDPMQSFAYSKVKELDTQIATLRSQLA